LGANREGFRRKTGVMGVAPIFERGCAIFPDAERDGASAPPEGWGGSISISNAGGGADSRSPVISCRAKGKAWPVPQKYFGKSFRAQ
jgi:hypothetical protein